MSMTFLEATCKPDQERVVHVSRSAQTDAQTDEIGGCSHPESRASNASGQPIFSCADHGKRVPLPAHSCSSHPAQPAPAGPSDRAAHRATLSPALQQQHGAQCRHYLQGPETCHADLDTAVAAQVIRFARILRLTGMDAALEPSELRALAALTCLHELELTSEHINRAADVDYTLLARLTNLRTLTLDG